MGAQGAVETALYNKLIAGTALIAHLGGTAIYNKIAPANVTGKIVTFHWQGGGDENSNPRRSRSLVYTVKGVTSAQSTAEQLDGDIDGLLHLQELTVTGFDNFWMAREGDVNYVETNQAGAPIYHIGGMYRIRIDTA